MDNSNSQPPSGIDAYLSPASKTLVHVSRVLIIEDDVEFAEWIQATLKQLHMLILCETQGSKALERYNDFRPDLVLLDISLPDMSGWTVLDTIRESKAVISRPGVIIVSAYGDPANRLAGKLRDVDGYLVKPVSAETIKTTVLETLRRERKDQ